MDDVAWVNVVYGVLGVARSLVITQLLAYFTVEEIKWITKVY
jgi:hypothetical protein